ncbi:MAG: DUF2085 domain-containing protein [Planctomycetota bacterium]|jgi:uncharacterized membrane protein
MNFLTFVFSYLCSQDPSRSFEIGGWVLPFCQRCTGLYVGLGISFIYLFLSGHYKKGLPPRSIVYVNVASLLMMPVFGFHFLDPGPAWRFWGGLIYGNAVASLLLPAASIICNGSKVFGRYTKASVFGFFVFFAFLNTISFWFPVQSSLFYYVVLILASTGFFCVLSCLIAIIVFLMNKMIVSLILKGFGNGYAKN